ncbi:MAG: cob(I)yrinic acid a,c-diamide adenosyltransferase [Lachnospiraceae bacterium]|nr:cob(I)yrinic acid a,c-diamide adenosyltransferase [Lachnospiraceae bacterium]MBQ2101357.1 cob(I)yrinic acid a,c-diamide adenosyltransferase [Lachnospiraceae bacterium]MBQ3906352.1 cob(I)yrinic acid a,c-diamide adenosyltransferase [Lachnospiraceae bacterium]
MDKGLVTIFTGDGRGKTSAAIGRALQAADAGQRVVIIQFLKGKGLKGSEFVKRLEPEIMLFCFEKSDESFDNLTEEQKQEETRNIRNGLAYANKVLGTGQCDLLILDEVLGLIENGIVTKEELINLIDSREETSLILTGIHLEDEICFKADEVSKIDTIKFKIWD